MNRRRFLTASAMACAIPGLSRGSEPDPSASKLEGVTVDQIKPGARWAGPEWRGGENLEGKVVLMKIFGG